MVYQIFGIFACILVVLSVGAVGVGAMISHWGRKEGD